MLGLLDHVREGGGRGGRGRGREENRGQGEGRWRRAGGGMERRDGAGQKEEGRGETGMEEGRRKVSNMQKELCNHDLLYIPPASPQGQRSLEMCERRWGSWFTTMSRFAVWCHLDRKLIRRAAT